MILFKKQITAELHPRERRALYVLLSFFLPFAIMMIAIAGLGITPFGDHTLVISDANGYYINTMAYAGRMFRGLEGITYSFKIGLGGNLMGHMNGIFRTPFTFLLGLVDITQYPTVYTFISVLNFCLCGVTMYLYLADQYGHKRSHLIFSTSYALMGFNVANVFQAFFFTAAPVLPLMALGLKKLMQGKSPILYIICIAYGLFSNLYFGFNLCIASVLFFFTELFVFGEKYEGQRLRLFIRYALASICGGLLVCAVWLPSLFSYRGGRLEQNGIGDFTFGERQPLLEIGSKLFTGANTTGELVNGHPNIYVGLLPVALVILFFMQKEIKRKKKIAAGILLSFYLITFTILAFDMVMHGGTVTNWFNFRYSYVFSFLLLIIAASVWERLDTVTYAEIKRCLAIMVISAVLIFSKQYEYVIAGEVLLDFALFLLVLLALWMHRDRPEVNTKKTFEMITLMLVCIGLFLNYRICTKNIREWEAKLSDYQKVVVEVDPLVKGIQGSDSDFYRMEVNRQRSGLTGNDPLLYGYNGVGHGSSNERDFVRTEGYKLGIPWFSNRAFYADGIPAATDTLLGVKYVIAEENLAEEKGYEKRITLGDWTLYENHDALPIVMLASSGIETQKTELTSLFDNLNQVWQNLSGSDKPVFIEEDEITFRSRNLPDSLEIDAAKAREAMEKLDAEAKASESSTEGESSESSSSSNTSIDRKEKPEDVASIEYTWTAKQDGPVFVYERNGLADLGAEGKPSCAWLGNYHKGDTVTGYLRTELAFIQQPVMEELCGRFRAAYADNDALHELSEIVRSRPVTVEKLKDSHLRGEFTAEAGQKLMFTIPYDEGWTCFIDGQKAEIKQVLGIFMAVDAPEGTHSYEMKFFPVGMKTGIGLSAAALLTTMVYIPVDSRRRKKAAA